MVCKLQKEALPALNGSSGEQAVGSSSFCLECLHSRFLGRAGQVQEGAPSLCKEPSSRNENESTGVICNCT